jgi:hypothetical protein
MGPTNAAAGPGETGYIGPEPVGTHVEFRGEDGPELVDLPQGATAFGPASLGVDFAAMTIVQLRLEAKERGLSTAGSKAELVARVSEHGAQSVDVPAEVEPDAEEVPA